MLHPYIGPWAARRLLANVVPDSPARPNGRKELLVDVSTIVRKDARTGIQRVVRAMMLELLREPPPGYDVRPVQASRWRRYRYADDYAASLGGQRAPHGATDITPAPGDVFLALDLTAHVLPRHRLQLAAWKSKGARISFLVHDLLPAQHPEWFTARASRNYARWVGCLAALADNAICTSQTGADQLRRWLAARFGELEPHISIGWFHLGSDIEASTPSAGLPERFGEHLSRLQQGTNVLVIGTIEPRKAHDQLLAAFDLVWQGGQDANLVIVGSVGWKSGETVARLRVHPESGKRLHWFENVSDEALARLYEAADGVLMPSMAEGFGLPVVEAARRGKPLLLRDIPIFREIAAAHAEYFERGASAHALASAICRWIEKLEAGTAVPSAALQPITWRESAARLVKQLPLR